LKGRFVCVWNCVIFFVGEYSSVWPEICRVLSQIQWRFLGGISGKNYSGKIFQKFCANQGYPLPKHVKYRPNFCNFIMGPYCAERNSHKYFRMLFPSRQGGTSINESQKEDTGKKSQDVLLSENWFCSLSVWDLLRLTPWVFWSEIFTRHSSLCLLSFGWGWAPDSFHKIGNKFFIRHCQGWKEGSFVCETVIFFVGEYSSVWPEICRVLSQIQWRFLGGISGKNYSGIIFQKFCANQGYPLLKHVKFRPNFCNFIMGPYCAERNSHKHFRMLFPSRQGGTSIKKSKKEDKGTKSQDVLFLELVLFTLGLGLTMPHSSGILVWNFYQTFITVSIGFWLRFEPQSRPTRLTINFLFVTARAERKVRLCVKLFHFLSGWILIRLSWNLSRLSQTQWRILGGISGKKYSGRIFQKFCPTKAILYRNLWNFGLIFPISFSVRIALKEIHTNIFLCCFHPGKKERP